MPKIIALVVTHNRLDKLKKTLSLISPQKIAQLVIVNCGSTDGTSEWLTNHKESHWRVFTLENIGGAGGFAYGSRYAADNLQFDWLLLFDDDAYPDKDLIETFSDVDHSGASLVGCKVIGNDSSLPVMNRLVHHLPQSLVDVIRYTAQKESFLAAPDKKQSVILGSFVGLFIRYDCLKQTIDQINPALFVYYDDAYYTRYCTLNGFTYIYQPALTFVHDIPKAQAFQPWKFYLLARNQFIQRTLFAKPSVFYTLSFLRTCHLFISACKGNNKWASLKAITLGITDGFKNRFFVTSTDAINNINRRIGFHG